MVNDNTHTLVNKETGDLAFKMYHFNNIRHFDHVQRLSYYSLIWIQKGKGKVIVDFNTHDYGENYLFSFSPFQPFLFEPEKEPTGVIIHFHSDFFCIHKHHSEVACNGVLFDNAYDPPFVVIDDKSIGTFEMIIQEMQKDIEVNQIAMNESVFSYLKLFMINSSRLKNEQAPDLENSGMKDKDELFITKKLKDLIEENFHTKHAPKDYAEALHISPKALAKISKQYFNKTLTSLISERIIIEAKRELYLTSKSVKEIATELGYEDEFYFSRFFKKNANITPSGFRKTIGFAKGEM